MATDASFHTSPSLANCSLVQEAHATQDKELSYFCYMLSSLLPLKFLLLCTFSRTKGGKAKVFLRVDSSVPGNSRQEAYLTPHYQQTNIMEISLSMAG